MIDDGEKPCPYCGGTEFVEGKQGGYGAVLNANSVFNNGVPLYLVLCTNCGTVVRSYVRKVDKIRQWREN